jgi:tetratricopeptide (TPR) repeat protein
MCAASLVLVFAAEGQTVSDYDALVQKGKTQLQAGSADMALATGEAAIKISVDRWEGYALAGGALMNLKRYEEAADRLSQAIARAPETKQTALRDLRRQSLLAESGVAPAEKKEMAPPSTSQAEIVLWKSIENSANPADFQTYLDQYPTGAFATLAKRHLAEIKARVEEQQRRLEGEQRKLYEQQAAKLSWTDSSTGLMWQRGDLEDYAFFSGKTFAGAVAYCAKQRLLGYSDWRLPTADELQGIYQRYPGLVDGYDMDGEWKWSTTRGSKEGEHIQVHHGYKRRSRLDSISGYGFAWCVRDVRR